MKSKTLKTALITLIFAFGYYGAMADNSLDCNGCTDLLFNKICDGTCISLPRDLIGPCFSAKLCTKYSNDNCCSDKYNCFNCLHMACEDANYC